MIIDFKMLEFAARVLISGKLAALSASQAYMEAYHVAGW